MHKALKKAGFPSDLQTLFETYGDVITVSNKDNLDNFTMDLGRNSYCFLSGLVKVYLQCNEKKIYLYHLPHKQDFLISIPNLSGRHQLNFQIEVIEDTIILVNANNNILQWSDSYKELRDYIIKSYQSFFAAMLENIRKYMDENLENRLLDHLKLIAKLSKTTEIVIPIQELAIDLNFSREAISRGLKKLEHDHKIIRKSRSILILDN